MSLRVYTGISRSGYHGKSVTWLVAHGLPKGAFVGTTPYIGGYYVQRHYPGGIIVCFDIPDVEKYSKVTDDYKIGKSLQLVKKPPGQRFVAIGDSAADFLP